MKNTICLFFCLVMAISGQGQKSGLQLPLTDQQKSFFLKNGFPINEYDYTNPYINEQLALAWRLDGQATLKSALGGTMVGFGIPLTVLGAAIEKRKTSYFNFFGANVRATSDRSGLKKTLIGTGLTSVVISIPLIVSAGSQRVKISQTMLSARRLYKEQNLKSKE